MPRQYYSRKRRSTEEVILSPPAPPMSESATKTKEFDHSIFPLKRTNFTTSRLDSESSSGGSSSSSSSSKSCHDLPASSAINNDIDDELDFFFNDLPPVPPMPQQAAAETIVEPPTSVLDCFANDCQQSSAVAATIEVSNVRAQNRLPAAVVVHHRRHRRSRSKYQPSTICHRPSSGAQQAAVLHRVNRLLESTKQLSSETSLLQFQAAKLLDDVISSRRLAENKPKSD